jgi:hypothetical protein
MWLVDRQAQKDPPGGTFVPLERVGRIRVPLTPRVEERHE